FTFLGDGEQISGRFTFAELDAQAKAIAQRLLQSGQQGQRVLLLYNAGLNFIASFFGCLYAGMIAVPLQAPRRVESLEKVIYLIDDCNPSYILTTQDICERFEDSLSAALSQRGGRILVTDSIVEGKFGGYAEDWTSRAPIISHRDIA